MCLSATMRRPLRSKRAMISPVRLRANASGLTRMRVRSMCRSPVRGGAERIASAVMRAAGLVAAAALLVLAPDAPANGTVTLTGTETRDVVHLTMDGETLIITPAVGLTFTDPSGHPHDCATEVDPLVNRPVARRCGKLAAGSYH